MALLAAVAVLDENLLWHEWLGRQVQWEVSSLPRSLTWYTDDVVVLLGAIVVNRDAEPLVLDLPDAVAFSYDIVVHSHGGLVINYLAIRGKNGEDLIEDRDRLEPRTGVMKNYFARKWGLQSYHVSFSRFDDRGTHTNTSPPSPPVFLRPSPGRPLPAICRGR